MKRILSIVWTYVISCLAIPLVEIRYGNIWNLRKVIKGYGGGGNLRLNYIMLIYKNMVHG